MTNLTLVPAGAYFQELLEGIPKAKRRILINSMSVLWGPRTELIVPLLKDALARGLEVRIVGDYYSKFQANRPRVGRAGQDMPLKWTHTKTINNDLEAAGAHIVYVGKLGLNPFRGRYHSKITVIDNTSYTFGGVNFLDQAFDNYDYMFKANSQTFADMLDQLLLTLVNGEPQEDRKQPIPGIAGTLLYDSGQPGVSSIYQTACGVTAAAKKIYYVSQMCPSGQLAKNIKATENYCYFVRPSQTYTPMNLSLIFDKARFGIKNLYKGTGYIHAKFILCETNDGRKHVISGSNNFSYRGIAYGTQEIALYSTDPVLWQQLYDFMQKIVL